MIQSEFVATFNLNLKKKSNCSGLGTEFSSGWILSISVGISSKFLSFGTKTNDVLGML